MSFATRTSRLTLQYTLSLQEGAHIFFIGRRPSFYEGSVQRSVNPDVQIVFFVILLFVCTLCEKRKTKKRT